MDISNYKHLVQYYETDKMGCTHHSNYIRWMEEARCDFFKKIGYDYMEFEKLGVASPVVGLNNIKYKKPSTFGDEVEIKITVKAFNSIVLTLHYEMTKDGVLLFEGDSESCFLSNDGKLVIMGEQKFPGLYHVLKDLLENNK